MPQCALKADGMREIFTLRGQKPAGTASLPGNFFVITTERN
jgi:hypothetical protein